MAFLLGTNVVSFHALAHCTPAAYGFIPYRYELTRIDAAFIVVNLVTADSAEIYELERITREITVQYGNSRALYRTYGPEHVCQTDARMTRHVTF